MTSNDEHLDGFKQNAVKAEGPLKDIAGNSEAYARYLADVQGAVLKIKRNIETLETHVRVHCRGQRVKGDKWGQARLRAFPVERSVSTVLSDLESLAKDLEKSAHKHHAHAEGIQNVGKKRKDKKLEKEQKRTRQLQTAPQNSQQQGGQQQNSGYGAPTSVYNLRGRESA
ncbi:hypothetical protein [Streptomyces sp. NPDC017964]|uniref:hypothetical protein n=1 Tax=Streptomyces sp. NPDC017964 TaxID=3365022 RepID=UPI0037AE5B2F